MASIVVSGDTSGAVTISAPAVAGTTTLTLPSTSGTVLTTASSTGISGSAISSGTVAEAYGGTGTNTGYYGFKNRIINGAMVIDQRNAGASVTVNNNQQYPVDRFIVQSSTSTQFTAQQSTTAPTGFYNSLLITTSSANASGFNAVWQRIEANNTNDFGLGTASASTFTISFWVRSSVTGTYTFYIQNNASSYSYVTTYTISVANTWEYKTITVAGPTAGTWLTGNSCSLQVAWSLGGTGGTTSTLGSWQGSNVYNATGATGIYNTASATFYITGVQLEKGSTATSFDYRPYTTELQLCQRYYYLHASGSISTSGMGFYYNSGFVTGLVSFPVTMRVAPTLVQTTGTNYYGIYSNNTLDTFDSFNAGIAQPSTQNCGIEVSTGVSGTAGNAGRVVTNNASASIAFNSEL